MRSTLWFEDLLNLYDIPHEWRLLSGYHAEEYWKANLEQYLRWYTQRWRVECYNRLNPLIACNPRSIRLNSRRIFIMTLSLEEVERIARLARLSLSETEKELYRSQLSSIIDHVTRLQSLDTQNTPPTFSVLPLQSVTRADEQVPGLQTQDLLRNAPQVEDGQFRIPPVFE